MDTAEDKINKIKLDMRKLPKMQSETKKQNEWSRDMEDSLCLKGIPEAKKRENGKDKI